MAFKSCLNTVKIDKLVQLKGVPLPERVKFRQIIVTGPPGSGKSTLIKTLGGWPEEGYLDLAVNGWWRSAILNYRPREVHLGLPFVGHKESLAVFDREWLESPSAVDLPRIILPPAARGLLSGNWRKKYVFDIQLIPPSVIYQVRKARAAEGTHPVDMVLTESIVEVQYKAFESLARYFHNNGLTVIVRHSFKGIPRRIADEGATCNLATG